MEDQKDQQDLKPGELLLKATGSDYVTVPLNEPLKGHVDSVRIGEGKNFDTGEPEKVLVVNFKLDEEGDGQGQVYTCWASFKYGNEKSKLTRIAKAVFNGEAPEDLDPTSLVGKPLRFVLEAKQKPDGTSRDIVTNFFPPSKDQKTIVKDVVPEDIDGISINDIPF